ncbi:MULTISPECIES: MFS transporter [unclassified Pseudomonas]|jgi:predicted MFS family arabinose efflux permease|uniref:MFS transporter n=1 Tax=unclassified Pseudomonas TaxID=196821 RepID=UPI000A1DFE85|nr:MULTISPECIES: MFS transporter [unclassified Pseudomonas]MCH4897357.1 MFS transporter [Pseudomonas sp. B707]PNB50184.1 MFS transporter [Pseudomonas sp. GW456-12-10-14-LB2]TEA60490.1 MFS transporter [Pseudomonas sp. CH235]
MPFVIYIFTLSAFALGLAEFVPIGLTEVMAQSLGVNVEATGATITAYALGATVAAPIFSALTASWSRKNVMLATALVFSAGSLAAAFSSTLTLMLIARFIAGMGHGLFLAVASSTAARLAGPGRAGSAVAVVFGGFTLAMAIGVPISTYLGGVMSWRLVLAAIALFGAIGFFGLLFGMRDPLPTAADSGSALDSLKALFNRKLLAGALVTVLGYAGSFVAYTYIAPVLTDVTGTTAATVGVFMLLYGVMAAIGNVLGGKLTDAWGVDRASATLIAGIALVTAGMWAFSGSSVLMGVLVALLGMFSFAAVPALQARLIGIAEQHAPHAHGVAAGLNIAGFNSGIALGSVAGGVTISQIGLSYVGLTGAVVSALGLLLILGQMSASSAPRYRPADNA